MVLKVLTATENGDYRRGAEGENFFRPILRAKSGSKGVFLTIFEITATRRGDFLTPWRSILHLVATHHTFRVAVPERSNKTPLECSKEEVGGSYLTFSELQHHEICGESPPNGKIERQIDWKSPVISNIVQNTCFEPPFTLKIG